MVVISILTSLFNIINLSILRYITETTVATVVATAGLGIMVLMLPQQVTQTEQACKFV